MKRIMILASFLLIATFVFAQESRQSQQSQAENDLNETTESMSHEHHHAMGPHMHMSTLRDLRPGDEEKAQAVVDQARQAIEKYRDYNVALADGFKIFLPNVPQKMYHFTKWQYAMTAAFNFDATKPTSLLYEKTGSGYKLIGAMYTAPYRFTEDQLDSRIPLSVAQWHQHVNLCRPPKGQEREMLGKSPKFGLNGSISTQQECDAAGGAFMPHVFGWMVHLYPWEKTPDAIWSVERQMPKDKAAANHQHDGMNMSH
jgi:hypothetical protein